MSGGETASGIQNNMTSSHHASSRESSCSPTQWNERNERLIRAAGTKKVPDATSQEQIHQVNYKTDVIEIFSHDPSTPLLELILHPTELRILKIIDIKEKIQRLHIKHPQTFLQKLIYRDQFLQDEMLLSDILNDGSYTSCTRIKMHLELREDSPSPSCDDMNNMPFSFNFPDNIRYEMHQNQVMTLEDQRKLISNLVDSHCPEPGQVFMFGDLSFRYHIDESTHQRYLISCDTTARSFGQLKRLGSMIISMFGQIEPVDLLNFAIRVVILFLLFGQQLSVDAYILLTSILLGILLVRNGPFRLRRLGETESNTGPAIEQRMPIFLQKAGSIVKALILSIFPSTEEGLDE